MNPPLAYTLITAPDSQPQRYLLFLHGLLGMGANWRSFARRLVQKHPAWGAVLVDLRMHGASRGFEAPHRIDAAADDLVALEPHLPGPVSGVLGHSLGGKIALAYFARRHEALSHLIVLDSNPGLQARAEGSELTLQVLALTEEAPFPFRTHQDFWAWMEGRGLPRGVAQWLGMNLEHRADGYHFGPDLAAMRALLDDYFLRDLWEAIDPPPAEARIGFLLGGRSQVCSGATRARLELLAEQYPRFQVEELPNAGHWVHVDDPEGTFRFLDRMLSPLE
jgi:pimeloyl-ACP methyl ester carboxylesterase